MYTTFDKEYMNTSQGSLVWFHVAGETEKRLGMIVHYVTTVGLKKSHYIIWSATGWWVRAEDTVTLIS